MNEGVFLHIRFLVEPLPTVLARIRPGVRVDEQVGGQSRRSLKTLATNLTIKAAFLQREEPPHTHVTPHQRSHHQQTAWQHISVAPSALANTSTSPESWTGLRRR